MKIKNYLTRFSSLNKKNLTGFTPLDSNYLTGFTPLDKKHLTGFTLIELIVTSAIILLLIVVAAPSYDRVRAHNELNLSGQKLQNCIDQAKSLALGPTKADV